MGQPLEVEVALSHSPSDSYASGRPLFVCAYVETLTIVLPLPKLLMNK